MNSEDAVITISKLLQQLQLLKHCFTDEYTNEHDQAIDIYSKANSFLLTVESLLSDLGLPPGIDMEKLQRAMDRLL